MNQHLIIVESPAKCKKVEKILGSEYKCLASYGHICELSSLDQIDFNKYEKNNYKIIKEKQKNLNLLKSTIEKVLLCGKEIIIATDNDREGEGIGYYLCLFCKLPMHTTKRILFNEITEKALKSAIQNPTTLNFELINSQQTRQILDLCLGFKISPLLWDNVFYGLSAGRCQTPALNMIYDSEISLEKYKEDPIYNWSINGYFGDKNWLFKLFHNFTKTNEIELFLNECKEYIFTCNISEDLLDKRYPPKPLITSSLQQIASNMYGFTGKMTMKFAQDLYENGLITYMRTDSTAMSKDFVSYAVKYIKNNYGETFVSTNPYSKCVNKSKQKSQEAHECIRITNIETKTIDENKYTNNHIKIYNLIWKITLQSVMSNSIYFKNILKIESPCNTYFEKSFFKNKFKGFEILNTNIENSQDYDYIKNFIFSNANKVNIKNNKIICENEPVKIPKLLNESLLIKKLESYNIGRPSTYASIIQSIEKKYLSKEKKQLVLKVNIDSFVLENKNINKSINEKEIIETNKYKINEKGVNVLNFCNKYFNDILNYKFTNELEKDLDLIADGEKNKLQICSFYNNKIKECISEIPENINEYKIKISSKKINIGKYDNNSIYLNYGKFGYYLEYKKEKFSVNENIINSKLDISEVNLNLDTAIEIIKTIKNEKNKKILREINSDISIRKSDHGEYIYFKTSKMKQPKFINLKNFGDNDYLTCDINEIINYVNNEKNNFNKKKFYKKKYNK